MLFPYYGSHRALSQFLFSCPCLRLSLPRLHDTPALSAHLFPIPHITSYYSYTCVPIPTPIIYSNPISTPFPRPSSTIRLQTLHLLLAMRQGDSTIPTITPALIVIFPYAFHVIPAPFPSYSYAISSPLPENIVFLCHCVPARFCKYSMPSKFIPMISLYTYNVKRYNFDRATLDKTTQPARKTLSFSML